MTADNAEVEVPVTRALILHNPPKALIALVALILVTVLILARAISPSEGLPIITLIVGYSIGNGIAARGGTAAQPMFAPNRGAQNDTDRPSES